MKKIIIGLAILTISALSFAELPKAMDMMTKLEDLMELKSDVKAKVTLTQQKVDQGVKVIEMTYYRKDKDDSFLIVMNAPEADKGNGYLRVGENFWMYRKNTRTFQHINRDESIGGSNAKSGDFEKRKLTELYKPVTDKTGKEIVTEEMLGKISAYKFEVIAKVNDVDYPKKVYWVQKENFLPLREQSYSSSGTLMQTANFLKYTTVDGRYVAVKQLFVDEFEKGNKTMVELSGISTEKLDESIFTKPYLENLSK